MKTRTVELKVRISNEEAAYIDRARGKIRRAVFLRLRGLGVDVRPIHQPTAEALSQLSKIGNNLNQIARQLHTGTPARDLIDQVQTETWRLRHQLTQIADSTK